MRARTRVADDQYHSFTARLAAAGYQSLTMRVVAGCILSLSVPALLAGFTPTSVPWDGFRVAYLVIAVASLGLAVPWLRYRWPTRSESTAVVVLGTVALAAGSSATIDPVSGMTIASAFAFILGFTALFHDSRLLGFTIAVAGLTTIWLAIRITELRDVPSAVALTIPIVLLGVVVTFGCRTIATVGAARQISTEVDPVTGLSNREAFYEQTAALMGARRRDEDRYLVLGVVSVDSLAAIRSIRGPRGLNQTQVSAGEALRSTLRHDAVAACVGDGEFLVADTFSTADSSPLFERVRGTLATTGSGMTASIGVVSTGLRRVADQAPHDVIDELIVVATRAMDEARRDGGNQVRYRST